jgi:hypothetical protein
MTKEMMEALYENNSAAHIYALGFVLSNLLYVIKLSFSELRQYFKLDHMSSKRGGYAKIRIRLTAEDRKVLSLKAEELGPAELVTNGPNKNQGDNFEKVITELWTDKRWVKDSTPFWIAGDIRVDGEEIQIKFDGAELTNERTLGRLEKA